MTKKELNEIKNKNFMMYCFEKLEEAVEYDRFPEIAYYTHIIEKEQKHLKEKK